MSRPFNVMFICNEWESSKGGLSTFNREFAVNLAKAASDRIKVHCYVSSSSEEDREDASKQGVNLITAQRLPGSIDPMEWLMKPPQELPTPDVVVGHGRKFGRAAYFISDRTKCKWIHFVHVFCEDLGKHKLEGSSTPDAIADNEEKNKQELELCEAADQVIAVGSRLQRKYSRSLPNIKVEVITPGIFENFLTRAPPLANVQLGRKRTDAEEFSIFMIGRGSFEDFALKGYDIVANAVALLGRKFELTFVGSPRDEQRTIEKWFLEKTEISRNQLTIRGYRNKKEMKRVFCEADVIVMPSRTEGFGLVALEAISTGVPVLVSSESGIARALEEVKDGMTVVVDSDKPQVWAGRIKQLSEQEPKVRHARAVLLRDKYRETYTWKRECERFEQMIHGLIHRPHRDASSNVTLKGLVLPEHWAPMPSANMTVREVTLLSGSTEYQDVLRKVQATVGEVRINKIERIQNPHLYQCYVLRKYKMDKDLGGNSERQLFHGANAKNVSHINTHGFNRNFSGAHGVSYGRGLYFAKDAQYALRYPRSRVGPRHMYLARVLVGQYCVGNFSWIVPPPKNPSRPEIVYESVVDNLENPSIFVVFFDNQCYPEYLITVD